MPPITKLRALQVNPGNVWIGDGTPNTAMGGGDLYVQGTLEVDGALNLDGAIAFGNTLTVGEDGTGYDVKFFGATSGTYLLWDEDVDSLLLIGTTPKFRLGTFAASESGSGCALSADNSAAFRVYTDDGGAAIGSGTLARSGEFRNLQTYTSGNREQEAAGVVGKLVSVAGTNRHNMCGVMGSYEMKGTITVDGQIASTDTWVQAAVIGRVGMGTGTLTLNQYGVLAGVAAMSNIATAVSQTYTGEYVGFYVGAWSGTDDFEIGLLIEDGKVGTGIDIGAATTGILFSGDMTTGINMTDSLEATDAILIAGANADAVHISGSNTVSALHISGDQAIGILFDVDAAATDGLKFNVDENMALTRGIYLTGDGTVTTALLIDTDGTTAINVTDGFSGTDMIVLNGTATGYGIEISGACTTADLLLQDGATIEDGGTATAGSGTALVITQDQILLTGQVEIGSAWGADGAGAIELVDDGWDWAFQANGELSIDSSGAAFAGSYSSLAVALAQTGSTSVFGIWTDLVFSDEIDFSAADNCAALWAQLEVGTDFEAPGTAGDFAAGIYTSVKAGDTFTTGEDSVVNGVRVKGEIDTTTISHAGRLAAFECLVESGDQDWDYGLYVSDVTNGIYIAKGTGRAFQVGALSSTAQTGMTFVASTGIEAVSIYTDDGDTALTGGDPFVGIHSRSMFFQNQAGGTTCLGVFGQQKYEEDVDIGAGRTAAVEGYQELMKNNDVKDSGMVVGVNSIIECSAGTLTVKDGGICAGFMARLSTGAGTATQESGGILAGLYIDENIGTGAWGYGAYIGGADTAIYINPATCTSGIQIGEAANDATGGLSFNTTAPVGFYFDDGGSAVSAWGECVTVGLVIPTESKSGMTGWPNATHVYIDQRADLTGAVGHNMCALNASYLIRNNATLDGFDNFAVSAFNPNVNMDSGSALASGTTLACISFSGNWVDGVSGKIVPLHVAHTTWDWSAFLQIEECAGLYQDAAAGSNEKHLKVYLDDTLYTITMLTA